jgi:hypothetical protein
MQFTSQYPILVSAPQIPHQVRPKFCIIRPGGLWTPLIPLDELPGWLEFCNWGPDFQLGLYPVSMSSIPRDREYDVACRHCSHSVDSLHQSFSEREASSVASHTKSCPAPVGSPPSEQSAHASLPTSITSLSMGYPFSTLGHPPFNAVLQMPFVGMCLVDTQSLKPKPTGDSTSPARRMSMENASPPHAFGPMRMEAQPVVADPVGEAKAPGSIGAGSPCLSLAPSENIRRWDISAPWSPYPSSHGVDSPDKPQCVDSMQTDSLASTRSLTAAAILRMNRMQAKKLSRGSSLHSTISVTGTANGRSVVLVSKASGVSSVSKAPSFIVLSKHRRQVTMRRHRAQLKRASKSPAISLLVPKPKPKPKPEQPNSTTKRRDRRERMKRERKQSDRGKQSYYNKMQNPNWKPGMSKH